MRNVLVILILFIQLHSFHYSFSFAKKKPDTDCHNGAISGHIVFKSFKYCIHKTNNSKNRNLVYYFHGLGGDEHEWENKDFAIKMQRYWETNKIEAPIVVSVSLGKSWFLIPKNSTHHSGLLEIFNTQILPQIEAKLNQSLDSRILLGSSMGGTNVLSLLLNSPELFSKAAALCPVVSSLSPFSTQDEIHNYILLNNATPSYIDRIIEFGKLYFPHHNSWKNAHPFELIKKYALKTNLKPIFLSIGKADEYGVFNDMDYFQELYQDYNGEVSWYPTPGKHCSFNIYKTAEFITHAL
jgi:S-formylglutathione hydrolase FrmB